MAILVETSAEVARGGRIGDPPRAERVEAGLVGPQPFEVLQASPAGQRALGHVGHVVRFAIGQIHL